MALSFTSRLNAVSSLPHGTGTYTTSAFTPSNNSLLIVVCAAMHDAGTPVMAGADITITDSAGLTWTPIVGSGTPLSWSYGIRAWSAPVTTGTSMTVTFDAGVYSIIRYSTAIFDYTGYDTGTPTAGPIAGTDADGNGALSLTLSATPAAGDHKIGAVMVQASGGSGTVTEGTSWTEIYDTAAADWYWFQVERITGSTSTAVDWADITATGSPADAVAIGFIVKAGSGGGGGFKSAWARGSNIIVGAGRNA